jgi:ABC-type phosphate/phosphonate transport system substrate-binding protein
LKSEKATAIRLAALSMYDFPHLRAAHNALWQNLCAALTSFGLTNLPSALDYNVELNKIWTDPSLLIAQSCGYPLITELNGKVQLVATPRYIADGCTGAFYRCAIVVRKDDSANALADLKGRNCAINSWTSNSGMNLLRAAIAPLAKGLRYFNTVIVTGSHWQSLEAVADHRADVASIDGISLAHLKHCAPELIEKIRILEWTQATACLPLITANCTDASTLSALRQALVAVTLDPDLAQTRRDLLIDSFEFLPIETYTRVQDIEDLAVAMSYPKII